MGFPAQQSSVHIEERRRNLKELTSKTKCLECGQAGHLGHTHIYICIYAQTVASVANVAEQSGKGARLRKPSARMATVLTAYCLAQGHPEVQAVEACDCERYRIGTDDEDELTYTLRANAGDDGEAATLDVVREASKKSPARLREGPAQQRLRRMCLTWSRKNDRA